VEGRANGDIGRANRLPEGSRVNRTPSVPHAFASSNLGGGFGGRQVPEQHHSRNRSGKKRTNQGVPHQGAAGKPTLLFA
jgi:hypothetical protein